MENFKKIAESIIKNSNICPTNLQDIQIKADEKTREEFGIEEPIHLWESYCIGDAEEKKLLANHLEYDSLDELFSAMDSYYEQVSEELYEEFVNDFRNKEKIYRLINHDNIRKCSEAEFESYSLEEYNLQFERCYKSIDEAVDSEPEYLFDKDQMLDFLNDEIL